jgi:hypothetical protein
MAGEIADRPEYEGVDQAADLVDVPDLADSGVSCATPPIKTPTMKNAPDRRNMMSTTDRAVASSVVAGARSTHVGPPVGSIVTAR